MRWKRVVAVLGVVMAVATGIGLTRPAPSDAIIGGQLAEYSHYPWFVRVWVEYTYEEECGGSIIDPQYVLTAAHCVDEDAVSKGVGITLWDHRPFEALEVILHPLWGSYEKAYDLALIRVDPTAINGGGYYPPITPVAVGSPTNTSLYEPGRFAGALGRGASNTDGSDTGTFKYLRTAIQSDDYMDDLYNHVLGNDWWYARLMIGAGRSRQTTCYGDSGGPLVVWENGNRPIQVGVASFTNEPFFVFNGDTCDRSGAFAELSGSMLAWVGHYADIRFGWERCMDEKGEIGVYIARWGQGYAGVRPNHDNGDWWWGFTCHVEPKQSLPTRGGSVSRPPDGGVYDPSPTRPHPGGPNTDGVYDPQQSWGPRPAPSRPASGGVDGRPGPAPSTTTTTAPIG